MRKWSLTVAAIAAAIGVTLALMSTSGHLKVEREGLLNQSYCAISESINCDLVNASSYSEFLGTPVAWWGVIFYALIFAFMCFAIFSKAERRATVALAWFMSAGSVLYSIALAYIAVFVLGTVCLECLGMYLVNILLFIFTFVAMRVSPCSVVKFVVQYLKAAFGRPSELGFKAALIPHLAIIAAAFILGFAAMHSVQAKYKRGPDNINVDDLVKYFYMQSLYDVAIDPAAPTWGNPDAKVDVVEFSEFQCPFCKMAAFNVKPYLQEFKKDVRYRFMNYPLDNACNPNMSRPMHPMACYAARAGICANKKGDFWSFHDELFRNQQKLSEDLVKGLVKKRGWDEAEFMSCMDSPEVASILLSEISAGDKAYVTGTPTIFVNGRLLKYWKLPDFIRKVVREEIKRSKSKK
jgi:uncharacterized membrane protein/predicted DsbA family dithiol-disulfide isomerase